MKIFKTKGPDESRAQFFKRLAFDRLTQIAVGLALLSVSGGCISTGTDFLRTATNPTHEDIGAETQPEPQPKVGKISKVLKVVEKLVATGPEAVHRTPGQQMGLVYSAPSIAKEAKRKANNSTRLKRIYKPMQPKVAAVIRDMDGKGWHMFIDEGVYRTPADQMRKYRAGVSKVTWSFHNATNLDRTPGSLAADVVDTKWGWDKKTPKKLWLQLAASARAHGLETGCYFGLNAKQKALLNKAIVERDFEENVPIGWDPSHIQPRGLSMPKARLGARPKF